MTKVSKYRILFWAGYLFAMTFLITLRILTNKEIRKEGKRET